VRRIARCLIVCDLLSLVRVERVADVQSCAFWQSSAYFADSVPNSVPLLDFCGTAMGVIMEAYIRRCTI